MFSVMVLVALAVSGSEPSGLTDYPGFRQPRARVEAIIDRGTIQEIVIKCGGGTAIISYSKIERAFCTPKLHCSKRLSDVIAETCGKPRRH